MKCQRDDREHTQLVAVKPDYITMFRKETGLNTKNKEVVDGGSPADASFQDSVTSYCYKVFNVLDHLDTKNSCVLSLRFYTKHIRY